MLLRMLLRMHARLVLCCAGLLVAACEGGDPTKPVAVDRTQLYAALRVNHAAVVLSIHAPYDTVQLRAEPVNLAGEVITYHGAIAYRRLNILDTTVRVDSAGFVQARAGTNLTRVEARLTIGRVTRTDTTTIMVRTESPVVPIRRLEFFPLPPDSSWRWAGAQDLIGYDKWVRYFDTNGNPIASSRGLVSYRWNNRDVVSWGGGQGGEIQGQRPYWSASGLIGSTHMYAQLYAYGEALIDSVEFRRIDPPVRYVVIDRFVPASGNPTIIFYPKNIVIKAGATVAFFNSYGLSQTNQKRFFGVCTEYFCGNRISNQLALGVDTLEWVDSVDIVFDHPEHVSPGDVYRKVFLSKLRVEILSDGQSGNISAFANLYCFAGKIDQGSTGCEGRRNPGVSGIVDAGLRTRKFMVPGIYHYTSTRFPGTGGTITVEE